jgi:hypothetical protein
MKTRGTHFTLRHALAGLEAGVLGALLMMVWSMAGSLWSRRSIWAIPNLYATTFYGSHVYTNQFLRSSWSGMALILAICGFGGILWGLLGGALLRAEGRSFLALWGAMAGLMIYYLFFSVVWRHANPLIPLYAPEPEMQIGYVVWGIALARSPIYFRRMAAYVSESPQDAEAIRAGAVDRRSASE